MSTPVTPPPPTRDTESIAAEPIALSKLPRDSRGRIDLRMLDPIDAPLVSALGLSDGAPVRLANAGRSCIIEVHQSRIAIGRSLAQQLRMKLDN